MGKKSKKRSSKAANKGSDPASSRPAPANRTATNEIETKDNLRFADPFIEEDDGDLDGEEDEVESVDEKLPANDDDDAMQEESQQHGVQVWSPFSDEALQREEKLEMDASAYKMHHAMTPEWPCLSFDFCRDDYGESRTRFPHTLRAVVGSQAASAKENQLTVMKVSNLSRIKVETDDDILGEELNPNKNDKDDDNDDDSSSSSDEEIDLDPIVEHYVIPHPFGGINRVRVMPQNANIVATWSEDATVNIFNISSVRQRFDVSEGKGGGMLPSELPKKPFFRYQGHKTEGFALDWSSKTAGQLVTGDCNGSIHVWTTRPDGTYAVSPFYSTKNKSVEDLQWSPTEPTVFCSANCEGYVRVFDTRAPNKAMLSHRIHEADVNVISWNKIVTNLLTTGGDDGTLSVYDLRHFSPTQTVKPLARFTPHRTPLTSVEWHPTDESMLAASDAVGTYIYDFSVEEDDTTDNHAAGHNNNNNESSAQQLPPQLLFVHCGSEQYKEVHWHPQITSCIMTTALTGFSMFIPSNL
jgi:ribosome assembly protein RRB1